MHQRDSKTPRLDAQIVEQLKKLEWVTTVVVVEVDTMLDHDKCSKLPVQIAEERIQFLFNQKVTGQFCVEIVLDRKKLLKT